jgi:hypothetical protein
MVNAKYTYINVFITRIVDIFIDISIVTQGMEVVPNARVTCLAVTVQCKGSKCGRPFYKHEEKERAFCFGTSV